MLKRIRECLLELSNLLEKFDRTAIDSRLQSIEQRLESIERALTRQTRLAVFVLMLGVGFAAIGIGLAVEPPRDRLLLLITGLAALAAAPLVSRFVSR